MHKRARCHPALLDVCVCYLLRCCNILSCCCCCCCCCLLTRRGRRRWGFFVRTGGHRRQSTVPTLQLRSAIRRCVRCCSTRTQRPSDARGQSCFLFALKVLMLAACVRAAVRCDCIECAPIFLRFRIGCVPGAFYNAEGDCVAVRPWNPLSRCTSVIRSVIRGAVS